MRDAHSSVKRYFYFFLLLRVTFLAGAADIFRMVFFRGDVFFTGFRLVADAGFLRAGFASFLVTTFFIRFLALDAVAFFAVLAFLFLNA